MPTLRISLLLDSPDSWIQPWAQQFSQELLDQGHDVTWALSQSQLPEGDIAFFLSCTKIVTAENLARHKHNLVVHESALPQGRGFAPLPWQIIAGENRIPICLFEAVPECDAGPVYFRDEIIFEGHELLDELRAAQGEKTFELCWRFISAYPEVKAKEQEGSASSYAKRSHKDDQLDPTQTLADLFDQMRVASASDYPNWFDHRGHRYALRIEKIQRDQSDS